jgi:hypothetical protein
MSHFPSKLCNEMIKLRLEAQKKKEDMDQEAF